MNCLLRLAAPWVVAAAGIALIGCGADTDKAVSAFPDKPPALSESAKTDTATPAAAPSAAPAAPDRTLSLSAPAKPESAAPAVATPAAAPAAALAPDTILVKLDNKTITQGDLDKETKSVEKMMLQRGLSEKQFASMVNTFKPQILDGLVTQILIDNECAARKIAVSDDDVKKEIEAIKDNLPKTTSLESVLQQQGITQSMLEEQIQDQLKIEKLLKIAIADADVKKFYDDNQARLFETLRARHILIKTEPTDDAAQKAVKKEKAGKLRKQIVDGGDFAKLAKDNSDCPSKEFGGELIPPFRRGQMVKAFEDVAFSLKTNEVSQVVETDFGYHVIQTLEHQVQSFDEVKGRIAALLKGKKTRQEAEPMIKSLKEKAKITYLNDAMPPPEMMFPPAEGAMAPTNSQTVDNPESNLDSTK